VIQPFSGPNASYGAHLIAGCIAAVQAINAAGGVLGHDFECIPVDSKGDAADAVLAVSHALAADPNIVASAGMGTAEATAAMPLLEAAGIPTIAFNGDVSFEKNAYHYYWRTVPDDGATGIAMAIAAHKSGYASAALVFGNSADSQTNVPSILHAFPKLGGQIVDNVTLQPNQPSYQTEVAKLVAANPDVILTELDPQTGATFFGELKQQLAVWKPIIGTFTMLGPEQFKAIAGAVGTNLLQSSLSGATQNAPAGPAVDAFKSALLTAKGVTNLAEDLLSLGTSTNYDDVNLLALAMLKANTVNPIVYNTSISAVTTGSTIVTNFVDGAKALSEGKDITYQGATGPVTFDQYHNSSGGFVTLRFGGQVPIQTVSSAEISAAGGP
jgi:branched-chain amino acid transport system substrate-binding protein